MSEISSFLGNRIREYRREQGLSQEELAYRASLSAAHLGQIERGLKCPTIDTVNQLANALDITISDLFQEVPAKIKHSELSAEIEKALTILNQFTPSQQRYAVRILRILSGFSQEIK